MAYVRHVGTEWVLILRGHLMLICRVFIELCCPEQTGSADILVLARDALLYNPSIPLWKTMMNNLQRFESLGDNCEFAFFLRESGYDEGSLFRWTLIKTIMHF